MASYGKAEFEQAQKLHREADTLMRQAEGFYTRNIQGEPGQIEINQQLKVLYEAVLALGRVSEALVQVEMAVERDEFARPHPTPANPVEVSL